MPGTPVVKAFASITDGSTTVSADETREQLRVAGSGVASVSLSSPAGVPTLTVDVPEVVIPDPPAQVPPNSYFVGTGGYASLEAAVADLGSTPATVSFSADQTLTANFSSPSTLEILPLNGAKINHGSYTVAYAGSTARWPLAQVFNGTGTITLSGSPILHISWFPSVQAAQFCSDSSSHAKVLFPAGTWNITAPVIGTQFNWEGVYRQTYILKTANTVGTGTSRVMGTKTDSYAVDAVIMIDHTDNAYAYSSSIKNLSIGGSGVTVNYGIYAPRTSRLTIENVEASSVNFGFYTYNSWLGTLTRMRTIGGTNITFADDGSGGGTGTSMTFTGCYGQTGTYGYNITGLAYSTFNSCAADFISGASYQFISSHGITLNGCGTEQVTNRVFNFDDSEIVVNGFRALAVTGASGKGSVKLGKGTYIFNACQFPDYVTVNGAMNLELGTNTYLRTSGTTFPTNGNSYINYSGGAVWYNDSFASVTRIDSSGTLNVISSINANTSGVDQLSAYITAQNPELVVNGAFAADTDWTKGTGWAISGGAAVATAATGNLTQVISGLTVGKKYTVTYTATVTSGSVKMNFGSGGIDRTASGTYTETRTATSTTFYLQPTNFTGTLDNVSVKLSAVQ